MSLKHTSTRLCSVFLITIAVSACATKPREVVAEHPLVDHTANALQQSGEVIPTKYWEQLSNANVVTINHPQYTITLGPLYISALGNKCRELDIQHETKTQTRAACLFDDEQQNMSQWRLVPALESGVEDIAL